MMLDLFDEQVAFLDSLDRRQRIVANHILKKGSIRTNDIAEYFKIDKKTAGLWLKDWIDKGFVKRKDTTQQRNIEYILSDQYIIGI